MRAQAFSHYELEGERPILGVFGGSLGAGAINKAIADMVETWSGEPLSIVHLTGESHLEELSAITPPKGVTWVRVGFEDRMDLFYAASDLVVARAGGAVAELTATATPSVLVPGEFGSGDHQERNARALQEADAAEIVSQTQIDRLPEVVTTLLGDRSRRSAMAQAASAIAKPDAARTIARAMIEAVP
jgi:UDP-N-acetylglucosamine--N-acetylmuramyl-(pentapeptide) pyrophosphoryl-undecaprenol N-acetylglucosamine transferase